MTREGRRHRASRRVEGPSRGGRATGDERGSGSGLVACLAVVLVAATWVCLVVVGWLAGAQHASDAADLAALTGAHAQQAGGDACAEARSNAVSNDARLTACELEVGAGGVFVVDVTVEVSLVPRLAGGPSRVSASARAGTISGES